MPDDLDRLSPEEKRALLEKMLRQRSAKQRAAENVGQKLKRQGLSTAPLSFPQERLWFMTQLHPDSTEYNVAGALRVEGPLDATALQRALTEVVRRHEALRTRFEVENGQPIQRVMPPMELPLEVTDLRQVAAAEREAELQRRLDAEATAPFSLDRPPLLRARLFQLGPDHHVVSYTLHHIVTDGWSSNVFREELSSLYRSFHAGRAPNLPELPVQYGDYARWQREQLTETALAPHIDYWRKQLDGAPTSFELPADHTRAGNRSRRGARLSDLEVPKAVVAKLRRTCQRDGLTQFMVLEAAFHALLHRYTGQEDILVGIPISGRTHVETEPLIGMFVNSWPLRARPTAQLSFRELLAQVRSATLDAHTHQDVPFERLVQLVPTDRDPYKLPLIQVAFVLLPRVAASAEDSDLRFTPVASQVENAKTDLLMTVNEGQDALFVDLEYAADLYEAATVRRLFGHYCTLLDQLLDAPEAPLGQHRLLTPEEAQQLSAWNDTAAPLPQEGFFHELVEDWAERTPDALALTFADLKLSHRELSERSNRLARHLRALGVGPDVRVGICLERSLESIIALLAVLKAGGVYAALDPNYPPQRLADMIADARPRVVITHSALKAKLALPDVQTLLVDALPPEVASASAARLPNLNRPQDLAYIIYTSGSTGKPKGAMLEHQNFIHLVENKRRSLEVGQSKPRVLQFASLSFDASVAELAVSLANGGSLHLISRAEQLDTRKLHAVLQAQRVTHIMLTVSSLQAIPHEGLPDLNTILAGGEQVPPQLVAQWGEGRRFFDVYGPTEIGCTATIGRCAPYEMERPSIGKPVANARVYLLDAKLEPVPIGVPGELYVGGLGVGRGYLDRPELTAEKFIPDPFAGRPGARMYRTGDQAKWLADGRLVFLGRVDHQVKIRGVRIELGEIEALLAKHPALDQAVVVARDGRLVAYVTVKSGGEALDGRDSALAKQIKAYAAQHLSEYMVPSAVVVLERLPLSPNGKVDQRALPEPVFADSAEYVAPRSPDEAALTGLWSELLGVPRVGIHDNFFELGGHSLLATRMMLKAQERLGGSIELTDFFLKPTIAEMAKRLRAGLYRRHEPVVAIRANGKRAPLFCAHPFMGGALVYATLAKLLSPEQPVYGLQAPEYYSQETFSTFAARSAFFLAALRKVQPHGPYRILGYSSGGFAAFELAQQLVREGEQVELLALVDTPADIDLSFHAEAHARRADFTSDLDWYLAEYGDPDQAAVLAALAPEARAKAVLQQLKEDGILPVDSGPEALERFLRMAISTQESLRAYRPARYPGKAEVFLSEESRARPQPSLFDWTAHCAGEVGVHAVPGSHIEMVSLPAVRTLAEKLERCLDALEAGERGAKQA